MNGCRVHRCGRVKTSLHRDDPSCARGLQLPRPAATTRFALSGHQQLGRSGPLVVRRAALATAGSGWYLSAALRLPRGISVNCMCNGRAPSRVTWNCPNTASCRDGLILPSDRAAEKLFAAPIRSGPLHPRLLPMRSLLKILHEPLYLIGTVSLRCTWVM